MSLRLFVVMLAVLLTANAAWIAVPAYRQQRAIRDLRKLGVEIRPDVGDIQPKWLREWINDSRLHPFGRVQNLDLSDRHIRDADLASLKGLKGLEWLALNRNAITDTGIDQLNEIPSLLALRLEDTALTDFGLARLKGLRKLEVLSLKRTRVTNAGIRHLREFPLLRHLDLEGDHIDDAALRDLKSLTHLRELRLAGTQISPAGITELRHAAPHLCLRGSLRVRLTVVGDRESHRTSPSRGLSRAGKIQA